MALSWNLVCCAVGSAEEILSGQSFVQLSSQIVMKCLKLYSLYGSLKSKGFTVMMVNYPEKLFLETHIVGDL